MRLAPKAMAPRVTHLLAVLLPLALNLQAAQACTPDAVEIKGASGKVQFKVDVADDPFERAEGLMHVESMPRFSGMLFIYETPGPANFWMKNTLIPLDMLFADQSGTITHIHENAEPLSLDSIHGGKDILYVLEINGGLSAKLGIEEGAVMRHPGMDQENAVWACAG